MPSLKASAVATRRSRTRGDRAGQCAGRDLRPGNARRPHAGLDGIRGGDARAAGRVGGATYRSGEGWGCAAHVGARAAMTTARGAADPEGLLSSRATGRNGVPAARRDRPGSATIDTIELCPAGVSDQAPATAPMRMEAGTERRQATRT